MLNSPLALTSEGSLTGEGSVSRVYTDLAVFDVGRAGASIVEAVAGVGIEDLRRLTGLPLSAAHSAQAGRCCVRKGHPMREFIYGKIGRASCRERVLQYG